MAKTAPPKQMQASTGKAEMAPNPPCASPQAAAKAGVAGKYWAPQQPRAVHICLCQHCHGMLQRGKHSAVCSSTSFSQRQPAEAFGSGFFFLLFFFFQVCQQNYCWADDLCSFRTAASRMHCLATLPCTQRCLDSAPAPFPPYGLSSLPLPPCSGAFPTEACRERQPPSLPPLCSVGAALCSGTRAVSLAGVN